jgi:hypothetical protein
MQMQHTDKVTSVVTIEPFKLYISRSIYVSLICPIERIYAIYYITRRKSLLYFFPIIFCSNTS